MTNIPPYLPVGSPAQTTHEWLALRDTKLLCMLQRYYHITKSAYCLVTRGKKRLSCILKYLCSCSLISCFFFYSIPATYPPPFLLCAPQSSSAEDTNVRKKPASQAEKFRIPPARTTEQHSTILELQQKKYTFLHCRYMKQCILTITDLKAFYTNLSTVVSMTVGLISRDVLGYSKPFDSMPEKGTLAQV